MPYLWIGMRDEEKVDFDTCPVVGDCLYSESVHYPVSEEAHTLVQLWWHTSSVKDSTISGVLADYLSDHRSELIAASTNPDLWLIDQLIDYLRNRFNSYAGRQ